MSARLRAVFLDVGNTLLHEVPPRAHIYAEEAAAHGVDVEPARMRSLMRRAASELPRHLADGSFRYTDPWFEAFIGKIFRDELGLTGERVTRITQRLFQRFEAAETFRIYPGAHAAIRALKDAGLTLGIVSNWSARLPRLLAAVGLLEPFDFVVCSALEGAEKPEPALFEAALRHAAVSPREALHAGDHPEKDYRAARAVGLHAVLVAHPDTPEPVRQPPEDEHLVRVAGLPELSTYILGLP